jgi:hypothetical protein
MVWTSWEGLGCRNSVRSLGLNVCPLLQISAASNEIAEGLSVV